MAIELTEAGLPLDGAIAVVQRAIASEYGTGPPGVPLSAIVVTARP